MLIIDLHYIAWRAYHSTGSLSSNGKPTGVIYGVLRDLHSLMEMFPDPVIVIAADSKNSLRKKLFPGYKLRPEEKDPIEKRAKKEAVEQIMALKREILPALGFRNLFEFDGFEADDIMAELVLRKAHHEPPVIVTGDEDMFQLLYHCDMYIPQKTQHYTFEDFIVEYPGMEPSDWATYKALAGCSSDTVPGVSGIGPKNAIQYILKTIPAGKKRDSIQTAIADGTFELMRKLVTLPFPGLPEMKLRPFRFNQEAFDDVCEKYEFRSLKWRKNVT